MCQYGFAVAAVLLGYLSWLKLTEWVGPGLPTYITFYPVVMAVALFVGLWPGVLATVLSGIIAGFWILPPVGELFLIGPVERLSLALFICMGLLMSVASRLYRRNRDKAAAYDRESALRESEERLRLAQRAANVGIWDWHLDTGQLDWTPELERIFGYAPGTFPGNYAGFRDRVHPDDLAEIERQREAAVAANLPFDFDFRVRLPSGETRWVNCKGAARYDAAGHPQRLVGINVDITDRNQAAEALRQSEYLLARSQEIAHVGSWMLDLVANQITWSDEAYRIFGLKPQEFGATYEAFLDIVHPDDRAAVDAAYTGSIREGKGTYEIEHRIVHKDTGEVRWVREKCIHERNGSGHILRSIGMTQDITDIKQAEEALRASENRHAAILKTSMDGFMLLDTRGRLLQVNDTYCRMSGYSEPELLSMGISDLDAAESPDETRARIRKIMEHGEDRFESRHRRKDGTVFHVEVSVQYKPDKGGYQVVFVRDITERKQAEIALKKREAIFSNIVEQATDAIAILDNATGRFVEFNRAAYEGLGYSREEFGGLAIGDIQAEHSPEVIRRNFQIIREEGQAAFETKHLHRNGEIRDARVSVRMLPVKDYDCSVAVWTDITEKKRAEAVIRESEDRSRRLIEASTDGIILRSKEIIIDANPAAVKLFRANFASDLIGKPYLDFVHPDDRAGTLERVKKILSENWAPPPREHRILSFNGEVVDVESTAVTVLQGDEKLIFGVFRDITERKRVEREREKLEDQLRQAQKMESLGTLAGGIAHDFNNILGVIIGSSEILAMTDAVDETSKATLNNILSASQRAKELVRQILAFSRHAKQEKILLNLKPLVRETFDFLRASIPANIQLKQQLDPDLGTIMADPTQMQQILMNLCTNAVHAMEGEGGVLKVELSKASLGPEDAQFDPDLEPGKYVRVTVSDTGLGIARDIIDKVFDPYFTTKEKGKGTGLGLSVVHGIVKAHGGAIKVYSEVGKGTTFQVLFPCAQGRETPEVKAAPALPVGNERILLVDDEKALADIEKQMLSWLGYDVEVRTSAVEALEAFRANPQKFDLVITDFSMPQMTGTKLARQMTQIRPEVPIILCTGFSEQLDESQTLSSGIKSVLLKPLVAKELAEEVRKAIDACKSK